MLLFLLRSCVSAYESYANAGEHRAGCFSLIDFLGFMTDSVLLLFLLVQWVGVQCVTVVYPGNTQFLSDMVFFFLATTDDNTFEVPFWSQMILKRTDSFHKDNNL